ncbi:hypothetical protein Poli38472_003878 [Pythium oligandrum]|uniref:Protein kinase domain-containing protein n=1 Tax=Pythium oligandrum TaxID=41045 RepID=A0A8K1CPN7_PYTOL|nr:hypothetical protein Poli38472_003878 [Pythium oligandrum]|eukprot:TMW66113.1 hypothetical protein Poli38472_003878 [Pythium oligandrum]
MDPMDGSDVVSTTSSSHESRTTSVSSRNGPQLFRFFGRRPRNATDSDSSLSEIPASSDDEKFRMERVFQEISGNRRRRRHRHESDDTTFSAEQSFTYVGSSSHLTEQSRTSERRRRRRQRPPTTLTSSTTASTAFPGIPQEPEPEEEDDDELEITTEYLDAMLVKPDDQVLNKYTRFFLDAKLEELYQEYTAINWFTWARWHVMMWTCVHIFVNLLFIIMPYSGFVGMDVFVLSFTTVPAWIQYAYLGVAIPFAILPTEANPFQKSWRSWVCFILILFNFTFQIWIASANKLAVDQVEHAVDPLFKCIPSNSTASNGTVVVLTDEQLAVKTAVQKATAYHVTSIYAGALVQILAGFASLFSFVFAVSIRLEFVQVWFVVLTAVLTYVMVIGFYRLQLEWMTAISYLFAVVLLFMLSHSSDRNNRRSFLSQLLVEKENESLKSYLNKAEAVLMNDAALDQEKQVVGKMLDDPQLEHLELVRIPFSDIKFLQAIGRGAMGDVIKAKYYGTIVVCKRMRRENITEDAILKFREEVELMSSLRHPNIVQFIGATWDNCSNVCIVMEYLENGDMHSVLHSNIGRSFTWADPLLKMAIDAAQGMLYLHSQEIPVVHRDLKSVNVFCSATFGCKVGDFGLSRRYKRDIDALTTLVGTPFWLAPEIIRSESYGPSADVFSFGIVLTELETRRTPYHDQEETGLKVLMRIAENKLRPSLPPTCPPRRRQLILDCLDGDPSRRPDFAEILRRLQGPVQQEIEESLLRPPRDRKRNRKGHAGSIGTSHHHEL